MIVLGIVLIAFAVGMFVGVYCGVRMEMEDEQVRQERLRRLRRDEAPFFWGGP